MLGARVTMHGVVLHGRNMIMLPVVRLGAHAARRRVIVDNAKNKATIALFWSLPRGRKGNK